MRRILFFLMFVLSAYLGIGQPLSGTFSIPNDYPTIADAISDLNSKGVGAGGVIFNVETDYVESITSQLTITATGTAANPIVFQKDGAGANPKITRTDPGATSVTTLGYLSDAIIRLDGSDYITFDGIDIASNNSGIDYGYMTFKTATNGCQYVTIKNCNITMTKGTSGVVTGIYISNGPTSSSAVGVTVSANSGRNENITITGNTISNVHAGIYVRGATANYDQNIVIGQNGAGNIINNFGGGSATTTYGVYFIYVNNADVSYNTINNAGNGGTPHASTLYGVFYSTVTGTIVGSHNNFTMANSAASSATNVIYNGNAVTSNTFNNNTFSFGTLSSTGTVYLIYASSTTSNVTLNGNQTSGTINRTAASGTFYCYYNIGSPTSGTETLTNNNFSNISLAGTSVFYGLYSNTAVAQNRLCHGNTISNITGGTGTTYCLYLLSTLTNTIYNNSVYNITAGGTVYGLYFTGTNPTVYGNTIKNITTSGTTIAGVYNAGTATTNFYSNEVFDIKSTNTAPTVSGILITAGTANNVYNNFISDIKATASNNDNSVRGINITSTTALSTIGIYHNTIYLDATSTGTNFGSTGIFHTYNATATTAVLDMRNNIIVNNSTSYGTGLTVAFRRSASTNLGNVALTCNNNDLYAGTPGASNLIFYDGTTPYQNFTDYQSLVTPRDAVSFSSLPPFVDINNTPYNLHIQSGLNTKCESGGQEIITPLAITTDFDGNNRYPTSGYPDDPSNPATAPDVGADEFAGIPSFTCTTPTPGNTFTSDNSICFGNSITLTLENLTTGTGVSYKWKSSVDGSNYSDINGATNSFYTASPQSPLYYKCEVTCQNGPEIVLSNPVQITFNSIITSTTPNSRCGVGTVSLAASGIGSTIKWYSALSGGTLLGSGSPFTTPSISTTTDFYAASLNSKQGNVKIGTGTSTSTTYSPFYGTDGGIKYQYLFTAAELNAAGILAGDISSIAFNVTTATSYTYNDFYIDLGTTSLTDFPTPVTILGGLSQVYYTPSYSTVPGSNNFIFDIPFTWDGVSNIVISTSWSNNNTSNSSASANYNSTTNYSSQHYREDSKTGTDIHDFVGGTLGTGVFNRYTNRPHITFNAILECSSPRVAVTATVIPPPTLTITANQTVCNDAVATLNVTSNIADYDTYIWSPITNLFTDLACTLPYDGVSSETTIYAKTASAGTITYTCSASNASLCNNTTTTDVLVIPVPTISASPNILCYTGSSVITATPLSNYGTASFQWQNSSDNNTYSDISSATALTYTTPTISNSMYYKFQVKIGANVCSENSTQIVVNNPILLSTSPDTRCGTGSLTLGATASSGTINWYDVPSGGNSLGSGNSFITPSISTTTNYYASAEIGSGFSYMGPINTSVGSVSSSTYTIATYYNKFTTTANVTIASVDIFPTAAIGSNYSIVIQNSSGTELFSTGTLQTTVTGGLMETVQINYTVPPGTDYRIGLGINPGLNRNTTGAVYPYINGDISFTGNNFNQVYVYYLYNWKVGSNCSSPRQMITATVIPATVGGSALGSHTICSNNTPSSLIYLSGNVGNVLKWQKSDDIAFTNPVDIANTNTSLTGSEIGILNSTTYFRAHVQSGSCTDAYSNAATITVEAAPVAGSVSGGSTITLGQSTGTLSLNGQTGNIVKWQVQVDGAGYNDIGSSAGLTSYSEIPSAIGTYEYRAVIGNGAFCPNIYSVPATVIVNPVTIPTSSTWIGVIDNDWNKNANWTNGKPAATAEAIIPAIAPNFPTLTSAVTVNNLTIESNASGTGSLLDNGNLTINGTATVKQYIAADKWHFISSPVSSATTNVFSPALNSNIPIYIRNWNQATQLWEDIINLTTNLTVGKGYAIWATASSPTIVYNGSLNNTSSITYGNGWNLISNPFVSAIDWNAVSLTGKPLSGYYYYWNSANASFTSTNGTLSTNLPATATANIIPAMQGFFIYSDNAGTLGGLNGIDVRVHNNHPVYKSTNTLNDIVRITAKRGIYKDEALFAYNTQSLNSFNQSYDARKLFANNNNIPELYTISNSKDVAIKSFGNYPASFPLNIRMGIADNVTLTASEFANFDASVNITLEDMLTGTTQDLRQNPSYTFAASIGENANRFVLHFATASGINEPNAGNISIYANENTIYVNTTEKVKEISVYNMLGQVITKVSGSAKSLQTISMDNASGNYVVKVTTEKGVKTEKVFVK